jgi:hypothetical protein
MKPSLTIAILLTLSGIALADTPAEIDRWIKSKQAG